MPYQDSNNPEFRPSDYLRQRRPERYSDSIILEEPHITKDLLEYHLDTLTSRNQDREFEHFARRLAEKEICPNLLPQTGPTGGGDSKVDSESYPVAEEIALRWYLWDELVWIGGFAAIEMNVSQWRDELLGRKDKVLGENGSARIGA